MRGAFASIKAHRKNEASKLWYQRALDGLKEPFNHTARVPTKTAKSILLNSPTLTLNEITYEVLAKSLGAGVYELYLKEIK